MPALTFDIFTNAASGQALSVGNPQPHLHQANFNHDDLNQHWLRVDQNGDLLNRGVTPQLILSRTWSQAIDVVDLQFFNGNDLQQYPVNSGPNQLWSVNHLSDDPHSDARTIVCRDPASDPTAPKYYAIDTPYGHANDNPHIWLLHEQANQQWTLDPDPIGASAFKIHSLLGSAVLDVPNGSQDQNVAIQQFEDAGAICFNQYWEIVSADGAGIDNIEDVSSGDSLRIRSVCNGLLLQPQSAGEIALVVQKPFGGALDQLWRLTGNNAGWKIESRLSPGFVLDVQNNDPGNHAVIQVYPDKNGAPNQQWVFAG